LDNPELNLLVGLGLTTTLGVTISLHFLMNRQQIPAGVKIAFKYLIELGLIAAGYAYMLLFPSLDLLYKGILVLAMLLVAGIAILAVLFLRHLQFSRPQLYGLIVLQVGGLLLIGWLVIVLIRSLIPTETAFHFPVPIS
jgi:hypothetical protein